MRNSKKIILIAIIAILVILVIGGGVFAYLYFGTDTFLNTQQRFYKYIGKNEDIIDMLNDQDLKNYYEKQENNTYSNNGEITASISGDIDENAKQTVDLVQDHKITFSGDIDNKNQYIYENLNATYQDKDVISGSFILKGDNIGFKINDLTKYVVLENNNLKQFAQNLGITDVSSVPDKIDINELKKNAKLFSEQEIKEIKEKYLKVISNDLTEDMFSKEDDEENEVYVLQVNQEQAKKIALDVLSELEKDDMIKSKIKEIYAKQSNVTNNELQEFDTEFVEGIQKIKLNLENSTTESDQKLYLKVYVANRKLSRTEIAFDGEGKIIIYNKSNGALVELINDTDSVSETVGSMDIEKNKANGELNYNITIKDGEGKNSLGVTATYTGLSDMSNIQEKTNVNVSIDTNNLAILGGYSVYNRAKKNLNTTSDSMTTESEKLAIMNGYTELKAKSSQDNYVSGSETLINETTLAEYINKQNIKVTVTKNEDETYNVLVNETGNSYKIDKQGNISSIATGTIQNTMPDLAQSNNNTSTEENANESESKIINVSLSISNTKTFKDITQQDLNENEMYKINNKTVEQLQALFGQIGQRVMIKINQAYSSLQTTDNSAYNVQNEQSNTNTSINNITVTEN